MVRLDPLRERRDELPVLAQHLLERANQRGGKQKTGFSPQAISALLTYDWPGNLRELARVIDHAHSRRGRGRWSPWKICPHRFAATWAADFPPRLNRAPSNHSTSLLTEVERRLIETALRQARGNKSRAAELLGISRPRLYRRIKELNLPDDESADDPSHLQ